MYTRELYELVVGVTDGYEMKRLAVKFFCELK